MTCDHGLAACPRPGRAAAGSRLLIRTTRRQSLTEVGRHYYERCKQILADVEAAEASTARCQRAARATEGHRPDLLRHPCPDPGDRRLSALYPEVEIDLSLNDRVVDLVEEGYRCDPRGALADSSLIARPLAPYQLQLCASPDYLRRRACRARSRISRTTTASASPMRVRAASGASTGPTGPGGDGPWDAADQQRRSPAPGGAARSRHRSPADLGLADHLASGSLVPLLPDYVAPSFPMHIVYLPDRRPTPKLRSFVDFVTSRFGDG